MQILAMRSAPKRGKTPKQSGVHLPDAWALDSPESRSESKSESEPLSPAHADSQAQVHGARDKASAKSDSDIITEFAQRIGAPRGYVEFEFSIMKKLYGAPAELIIELYDSVLSPNTLPTFKLRYVRMRFRSICETKAKQKRI